MNALYERILYCRVGRRIRAVISDLQTSDDGIIRLLPTVQLNLKSRGKCDAEPVHKLELARWAELLDVRLDLACKKRFNEPAMIFSSFM